jgi:multidrug resistance efflux pump
MALSKESVERAVQRKAQRAHRKVKAAEAELHAANEALKEALPTHDVDAIAGAAERTAAAEDDVREAAHELEAVDELLERRGPATSRSGASGEGADSLLPWLRGAR